MSKTIAFAKHRPHLINTLKLAHLQKIFCVACVNKTTYLKYCNKYREIQKISFNHPCLTAAITCNECGNYFTKEYKNFLLTIK